MNRILLSLVTLTLGVTSFACPQLNGIYECEGTTKEFTGQVQIAQKGLRYYLPYIASNPKIRESYAFIADSRIYTTKEMDPHIGSLTVIKQAACQGNVLLTKSGIKELNFTLTSSYSLDKATRNIAVVDTYSQNNKVTTFRSLCKPLALK